MELENGVEMLKKNGFVAYIVNKSKPYILGGSICDESGEIPVIQDGFTIFCENSKWIVCFSSKANPFDEVVTDSLEAAVELIRTQKV